MKNTILATSIAVFVCAQAPAASLGPADDSLTIQTTGANDSPCLTLLSGSDSVTIRYWLDDSGASPVNITAFDSADHAAQWQWRTVPSLSGDPAVPMWLDSAAILGLNDPTSGDVRLKLSADRSITFSPITGETGDLVLHRTGATLNIGSYPILTTGSGDSRYIVAVPNRFQYGPGAIAESDFSFAFGDTVDAFGTASVAMGAPARVNGVITSPSYAHGVGAISLGYGSTSWGDSAVSIGSLDYAPTNNAVAIGYNNRATGSAAVAIGSSNMSAGTGAIAIGGANSAGGQYSLAFGCINTIETTGGFSVAGGYQNHVYSQWATAFGCQNQLGIWANSSMAAGMMNTVTSDNCFAAGVSNVVDAQAGVALGRSNAAHGISSVTMGTDCTAWGTYSLAVGHWNTVEWTGNCASALGIGTSAVGTSQFVVGSYNDPITDQSSLVRSDVDAAFIIGNGYQVDHDANGNPVARHIADYVQNPPASDLVRRNALVVRWNGNVEASGNVISNQTTGKSEFKAPVIIPESGDISMGDFRSGN